MKCMPVSNEEEEEIELVRTLVSAERQEVRNIVTPALLLDGHSGGVTEGGEGEGFSKTVEGVERHATGKRPRDEDGGLAELDKRRRGLELAIHNVMGGSELPPFDLEPPQKLPLSMLQKKKVTLAMHRQEVPIVNAFLTGVKTGAGELIRTKTMDFLDQVHKSAFGDMYLTLVRADKEVGLVRCHSEIAKAATTEAHAAIREKNVLQLKVGRLERELKEVSRLLEAAEEAMVEAKRKKGKDELKNLVLDAMVEE
ncbi:unnamed protein product [Prunus brigantina]